jgi:predicted RNase H-like HicB family nuclease
LSTEPLLKYTQRELDEMISVAVEESKKAAEGILTENTRLELQELTRMYEDTRNQYMDEIHRMQTQMQSLDISNVISEAVQEATRAANESLEKARQESKQILEIYEEQRHQYAEKMNSIKKDMEQIIQEYDINQNDTSESPPGQEEDADFTVKLLLKRLNEILAHQREKNVEKDKLITFLSTKLVDVEAVIINLEENNCMLEQKVGSTAADDVTSSAIKKRVTFKEGEPEKNGEEEDTSLKPEPVQLWFW